MNTNKELTFDKRLEEILDDFASNTDRDWGDMTTTEGMNLAISQIKTLISNEIGEDEVVETYMGHNGIEEMDIQVGRNETKQILRTKMNLKGGSDE